MSKTVKAAGDATLLSKAKAEQQKKKSESSKGSASGRNRVKCQRYKAEGRRERNKMRKLVARLERFPNDLSAAERIVGLYDGNTLACRQWREDRNRAEARAAMLRNRLQRREEGSKAARAKFDSLRKLKANTLINAEID